MNITSAKYKNDPYGTQDGILMVVDGVTIEVPLDSANSDYIEIQRQVAAGDLTIADAD